MLTVEEARTRMLDQIAVLPTEKRSIIECLGYVLAEEIHATENIPPFDNSAMDGYAVIADDLKNPPVQLKIIEKIAAGDRPQRKVDRGQTSRIMTGAMMPDGADSVVMIEETKTDGDLATISTSVEPTEFVRFVGESVKIGDRVIPSGKVMRPPEISMLAALNVSEIKVVKRPKVAVISTGDELRDLGEPLTPGKIRESNRYGISAQLRSIGCEAIDLGICRDDADLLEKKLRSELEKVDALITSGGVSVGDHDVVKEVLERLGKIDFWRVAMKPGKPQAFGFANGKPIFGLPGNPVSSLTVFELFTRPALLKMAGHTDLLRPTFKAELIETVKNRDNRLNFMRAIIEKNEDQFFARLTGSQGSGILYSLVLANGLIAIPPSTTLKAGETVEAQFLD